MKQTTQEREANLIDFVKQQTEIISGYSKHLRDTVNMVLENPDYPFVKRYVTGVPPNNYEYIMTKDVEAVNENPEKYMIK